MAQTIGILPAFCVPHPTVLVMKEKVFSFSGDDFSVKDQNGVVVCRVDGKSFSFKDQKDFIDPHGQPLFSLKRKLLSLHHSYEGYNPDGSLLFEVKGKFAVLKSKMVAHFTNASTGQAMEIEVIGNWMDRKATMTVVGTGRVIATISRQFFNARELFGNQQTYQVQVDTGLDLAAAMSCTSDEHRSMC